MKVKITEIKTNPDNPRLIKDNKFKKLVQSIKEFPEMLEKRPIVVDENMMILGGNMRFKASQELGLKELYVIKAEGWNDEQKKQFVIKDNTNFGQWDYDLLANEWNIQNLDDWGVSVPTIKNTELLSNLKYKSMYYEPKKIDDINLEDCIDLDKYNQKIKALDDYNISDSFKNTLTKFAYRFIKIDFEFVANYYYFQASDEEKKAIERLRLVLTDDGVDGFIQDDLLRILSVTDQDLK